MGASSLIEAAQNVGKYTLIEKIGEGYLGRVYRGFNQDLGTPVVVRILCVASNGFKTREAFSRESRALPACGTERATVLVSAGGSSRSLQWNLSAAVRSKPDRTNWLWLRQNSIMIK
jgi:hypothetical protein